MNTKEYDSMMVKAEAGNYPGYRLRDRAITLAFEGPIFLLFLYSAQRVWGGSYGPVQFAVMVTWFIVYAMFRLLVKPPDLTRNRYLYAGSIMAVVVTASLLLWSASRLNSAFQRGTFLESRLGQVIRNAPVSIIVSTPDGTITQANEQARRITGYYPSELTGMSFWDLLPPENVAESRANREQLLSLNREKDAVWLIFGERYTIITKDDDRFPCIKYSFAVRYGNLTEVYTILYRIQRGARGPVPVGPPVGNGET